MTTIAGLVAAALGLASTGQLEWVVACAGAVLWLSTEFWMYLLVCDLRSTCRLQQQQIEALRGEKMTPRNSNHRENGHATIATARTRSLRRSKQETIAPHVESESGTLQTHGSHPRVGRSLGLEDPSLPTIGMLKDRFGRQIRNEEFKAALDTGEEIVARFPFHRAAIDFLGIRPHILRRIENAGP